MKDLVVITAHCPTDEQINTLEKCINSVIDSNHHVALISHSHVPIHIQKKCNYYFYDYLNDTSDNYNFLEHQYFSIGDKKIQSIFFQKNFYGFAIYRMFSIASQIAINFGYKNIHHIEYDCELLDKGIILENSNLLETYNSVIYTHNGNEDGFILGAFTSFKVETLPNEFKNYNREFIAEEMMKISPKNLEVITKGLLLNSGKVLVKNENELTEDKFKKGDKFYNRNLHYTLYYDQRDKNLYIFYKSFKDVTEKICVLVNDKDAITIDVIPNHWHIRKLGVFDDINHVRIDNSEKIIYQKSFDSELKEIFKTKSYLSSLD